MPAMLDFPMTMLGQKPNNQESDSGKLYMSLTDSKSSKSKQKKLLLKKNKDICTK